MKLNLLSKLLPTAIILLFGLYVPSYGQNCQNNSTGLAPITDLGAGFYQGYVGGLYFGSNSKPAQHIDNLENAILDIKPLDILGIPEINDGKIVLLSVGASNPKIEFQSFQNITDTFKLINPSLEVVNGAQGGKSLPKIIDTTDSYWKYIDSQLSSAGVSAKQVQIIWLEEENTQSNNINFPEAPLELMQEFKALFGVLLQKYPNLKLCYLAARGYSGYIDSASTAGNGLRQPRDYYNGWAMKWLIEDQISDDTSLSFAGSNRKAPLLDWSAYLWTDGNNPREDGLSWLCPTDVKPGDGLHWSPNGNDKAGMAIFRKFYSDIDARKWFLNNNSTSAINTSASVTHSVSVYPNPGANYFHIQTDLKDTYQAFIYDNIGRLVIYESNLPNNATIYHTLRDGIYHLVISSIDHSSYTSTNFIVDR